MNRIKIVDSKIIYEQDVLRIRKIVSIIAFNLGMDNTSIAKLCAVVSDFLRIFYNNSKGSSVEIFLLEGDNNLLVKFLDSSSSSGRLKDIFINNNSKDGNILKSLKKMIDKFEPHHKGNIFELDVCKKIPGQDNLEEVLNKINAEIQKISSKDPLLGLKEQNKALVEAYEELKEKQKQLDDLNEELKETNSGVVALSHELEEKNKALHKQANLDGLTQIPNRRSLDKKLNTEWKRMKRERKPLGIIMIDIDYFKNYNDIYGHLKGDDILKIVGKTIESSVYRPGDFVARYGGEEFLVVLPDTDLNGLNKISENIREKILDLKIIHESSKTSKYLTVSLGFSLMIPEEGYYVEDLVNLSDIALYKAKNSGRNRVEKEIMGSII